MATTYSSVKSVYNQPKPVNGNKTNKHQSSMMSALGDLKVSVERNKRFGKMVMYSVECVGKMAVNDVSVEEICQSGVLGSTLDALKQPNNSANEDLQQTTNDALLRMFRNPHCATEVSKAISCDFSPFLTSLKSHKDRNTLFSTAEVLKKFANVPPPEGPKNVAAMREMGIYEALSDQIMACSDDDPELLAQLAETLSTGAGDAAISQSIINKGTIQKLLDNLEKNPNNEKLVMAVTRLVGQMASSSPEIAQQLRNLNAIGIIANSAGNFAGNTELKGLLANAMTYLADASNVQQVVAQLSVPGATFSELFESTKCTSALLLVEKHRALFIESGGVPLLIAALRGAIDSIDPRKAHFGSMQEAAQALFAPGILGVIKQSAISMSLLSNGEETRVYALMKAGAVQSLQSGMYSLNHAPGLYNEDGTLVDGIDGTVGHGVFIGRTYDGEAYHYTQAMAESASGLIAAMTSLITRPENVAYLVRTGALKEALELAHRMGSHPSMLNSLLDFYEALVPYMETLDDQHKALLYASLEPLIKNIKDCQNAELAARGLTVLGMMAIDEDAERAIIQAGGIEATLEAMNRFSDDPEVILAGLAALDLACMLAEGRQKLIDLGGEEFLRNLREKYRDNPEIRALCDTILSALARHRAGEYELEENSEFYEVEEDPAVTVVMLPASQFINPSELEELPAAAKTSLNRMPHSQANFTDLEVDAPETSSLSAAGEVAGNRQHSHLQTTVEYQIDGGHSKKNTGGAGWFGLPVVDIIEDIDEEEDYGPPPYILEFMVRIQDHVANRRGARLLGLYETLATQRQGADRDYLLAAVVDAIVLVVEVERERELMEAGGFSNTDLHEEHKESLDRMMGGATLQGETGKCLADMSTALVMNGMGERLTIHALTTSDQDLVVQSDLLVTLLWLFSPLLSSIGAGVEHCGMGPLSTTRGIDLSSPDSPNAGLLDHERMTALEVLKMGLEGARADLEGLEQMEEENMRFKREAEVLRLRAMAVSTREEENERILARMEESRRIAQDKADEQRKELEDRMEKVRADSLKQFEEMQRQVEDARQQQMNELVRMAREAETSRMEMEKRMAFGDAGGSGPQKLNRKTAEFLKVGGILTKHGESGKNSRHVYITPNLEFLCWKHASSPDVKSTQMMKIAKLSDVKAGRACADLQRGKAKGTLMDAEQRRLEVAKKLQGGILGQAVPGSAQHEWATEKEMEEARHAEQDSAAFFAIFGVDQKGNERQLGFEAATPTVANEWFSHLEKLVKYAHSLRQYHGDDTLTMMSNPLYILERMDQKVKAFEKASDRNAEVDSIQKEHRKQFLLDQFGYEQDGNVQTPEPSPKNQRNQLNFAEMLSERDEPIQSSAFKSNSTFVEEDDDFAPPPPPDFE